ncbi:hypothetical protein BN1723_012202 [Verticillium longisporum]|uniref:MalT-like TPR region domain-containing protein n=1 Tax=Verticillium longisporum TaxID=100787 RepID=A0A0G4LFX1_VERLO|nr:hypothetical protein BN1723_012202 [Verticillium longisporum]
MLASVLAPRAQHQLPFEKEHRQNIAQILRSCKTAIERLRMELPELTDSPNFLGRTKTTIVMTIKSGVIQGLLSHISSYAQVLQLSVSTLSLGSLRAQQKSQDEVQKEIKKLTQQIRSADLFANHAWTRRPSAISWGDTETRFDDTEALKQEIHAWRISADDVAAAATLQDSKNNLSDTSLTQLISGRSSIRTAPSTVGVESEHKFDDWDPQPHRRGASLGRDILEVQYEENQSIVQQLEDCGIFLRASSFQKRGIEMREQLCSPNHGVEFPFNHRAAMKEKLADILLSCETSAEDSEAQGILQGVLAEEAVQPEDQQDQVRLGRLYHKLGSLFRRHGNLDQAEEFLSRALEDRRNSGTVPALEVHQTAELLVDVLQEQGKFDEARGIRKRLRQIYPDENNDSPVESNELSRAYAWCTEHGFDIDAETFSFNAYCEELNTTPVHLALTERDTEILPLMGFVALLLGEPKEARGLFTHAMDIAESSSALTRRQYSVAVFDHILTTPLNFNISSLIQPVFALSQLNRLKPQDLAYGHLSSLFRERTRDNAPAVAVLEKICGVLETDYELTESAQSLARFALARTDLARLYLAAGSYEQAIECGDLAIQLSSDESDNELTMDERKKARLSAHLTVGLAQYYSQDMAESLRCFEAALSESDNNPDAVCLLAQVLWAAGGEDSRERARSALFEVIEAHPDHVPAVLLLGVIALLDDDEESVEAVVAELQGLRTSDKVQPSEHSQLGEVLSAIAALGADAAEEEGRESRLADAGGDDYAADTALRVALKAVPPRGTLEAADLARAYAGTGKAADAQIAIHLAPWARQGWTALRDAVSA